MSWLADLGNDVVTLLALRPSDLSRLHASCQRLRAWLTESDASVLWREATMRSWGVALDSWTLTAAHAATQLSDFDALTAFGAALGPTDDVANLELHACRLPYRAAAVVGAVPISSQGGGTVEWTVHVHDMPRIAGVVLWIGVMYDVRGAEESWPASVPRRLLRCGCTRTAQVPHEVACPVELRGRTMRDALLPFVPNAPPTRAATRSTAADSSSSVAAAAASSVTASTGFAASTSPASPAKATGGVRRASPPKALIERFHASPWHVAALGSTGWVWGAAPGGTAAAGLPRFSSGATVRVRLDRSTGRCSLAFGVDGVCTPTVAVKQLCMRGTPQPVLFYPLVHLTDISSPADADLPLRARVSISSQ